MSAFFNRTTRQRDTLCNRSAPSVINQSQFVMTRMDRVLFQLDPKFIPDNTHLASLHLGQEIEKAE
jgi:hypothetical protein